MPFSSTTRKAICHAAAKLLRRSLACFSGLLGRALSQALCQVPGRSPIMSRALQKARRPGGQLSSRPVWIRRMLDKEPKFRCHATSNHTPASKMTVWPSTAETFQCPDVSDVSPRRGQGRPRQIPLPARRRAWLGHAAHPSICSSPAICGAVAGSSWQRTAETWQRHLHRQKQNFGLPGLEKVQTSSGMVCRASSHSWQVVWCAWMVKPMATSPRHLFEESDA